MANISNANVRITLLDETFNPTYDEWFLMPEFNQFKELFIKASYMEEGAFNDDSNTCYVFGRWAFHANWNFIQTNDYLKELASLKSSPGLQNLKYIQIDFTDLDHSDFYEFGRVIFDIDRWDEEFIVNFDSISFTINSLVENFKLDSLKAYITDYYSKYPNDFNSLNLEDILKHFSDDHTIIYSNSEVCDILISISSEYYSYIEDAIDNMFYDSDIKEIIDAYRDSKTELSQAI